MKDPLYANEITWVSLPIESLVLSSTTNENNNRNNNKANKYNYYYYYLYIFSRLLFYLGWWATIADHNQWS